MTRKIIRRGKSPLLVKPYGLSILRPGAYNAENDFAAEQVVSLSAQAQDYLLRLRQSEPLPLTPMDIYQGLFPEGVSKLASLPEKPGRLSNLKLCIQQSPNNVVHVCYGPAARYTKAISAMDGYSRVFWIRIPENLPAPAYAQAPLFLPEDHPLRKEIITWAIKATRVERSIDAAVRHVMAVERIDIESLPFVWPELFNFLKVDKRSRPLPPTARRTAQHALDGALTMKERQFVTDQLTTAAMLPDNPPAMNGWAMFNKENQL